MTVADSLLWRNATRVHDWRNLEIPLRILDVWISLGLVTGADWVEGASGRTRKASIPASKLAETIRAQPPGRDDRITIRMGGGGPREWRLTGILFPKAVGMSLFNLTVAYDDALPPPIRLADTFVSLYSPETADAAFIHTDPQWTHLAAGPYKPPLVTTPTFAGVCWSNYLGPGHLVDFSVAKLKEMQAYRTEWRDDSGMFLIAGPTLENALTPEGEHELLRLTAEFRAAKL